MLDFAQIFSECRCSCTGIELVCRERHYLVGFWEICRIVAVVVRAVLVNKINEEIAKVVDCVDFEIGRAHV